jgi:hypothetical protein
VGESYLLAKGPPQSSKGEWSKVCQLLAARLPGMPWPRQWAGMCFRWIANCMCAFHGINAA